MPEAEFDLRAWLKEMKDNHAGTGAINADHLFYGLEKIIDKIDPAPVEETTEEKPAGWKVPKKGAE